MYSTVSNSFGRFLRRTVQTRAHSRVSVKLSTNIFTVKIKLITPITISFRCPQKGNIIIYTNIILTKMKLYRILRTLSQETQAIVELYNQNGQIQVDKFFQV